MVNVMNMGLELKKINLAFEMADNVKARVIDADQKNDYVKAGKKPEIRSQYEIYKYFKRLK